MLYPKHSILLALTAVVLLTAHASSKEPAQQPNVVLIFADDLGYGDLGCYGATGYHTPNLDRLANEGVRFTDFYVAQAVCSASRTALLTGCYPNRVGILGALGPNNKHGINDNETTLGELLQVSGYATAAYGKWHLGHHPQFLPTRHGFDEYFGLPYSNDMWPKHPETKTFPDLPLIEGEKTIELNPDQSQLTTRYTEHAISFIERHRDRPFFVYLAHSMPHVPLFVSDKFRDKTHRGLFGDVIEEVDWSVGRVLETLARLGLDERTLVIFTSDNGPWLSYGDHAGSAGALREGKGTSFDGGVREPCLMRWPGKIPAGTVCREPAMTIDILPTLAKLAGANLPRDRIIDGLDIWPLIAGEPGAKSPHEALYFYWDRELQAVRSGRWKLHLPHAYRSLAGEGGKGGRPSKYEQRRIGLSLFDLEADPGESKDVAAEHPEVVARLESLAEKARDDLGDTATHRQGKNVRPAGQLRETPGAAAEKSARGLTLSWKDNHLTIRGDRLPGGTLDVHYLEVYCRPGSTDRDWGETVIGHRTELVSADTAGKRIELLCKLTDGVQVAHTITASEDEVDFRLVATNPTKQGSQAHWAQPCIRVDGFTGRGQDDYISQCFVFLDGELTRLPTEPRATKARYVPGQVYCPKQVDRNDVNPRPLSELVPSNGLCGAFSADNKWIMATAWEPYQELFQGVRVCMHADFRIGGLKPDETKKIRGKIYVVPADVDALVARYERDFPEQSRP